jgi:glucan 1,3-beta-glucosidase
MPPETYTGSGLNSQVTQSVDGWFDKSDTVGGVTTVAGCTYPDEYTATFAVVPTAPCTGPGTGGGVAAPPPVADVPTTTTAAAAAAAATPPPPVAVPTTAPVVTSPPAAAPVPTTTTPAAGLAP